jgi:hypothetical protein
MVVDVVSGGGPTTLSRNDTRTRTLSLTHTHTNTSFSHTHSPLPLFSVSLLLHHCIALVLCSAFPFSPLFVLSIISLIVGHSLTTLTLLLEHLAPSATLTLIIQQHFDKPSLTQQTSSFDHHCPGWQ